MCIQEIKEETIKYLCRREIRRCELNIGSKGKWTNEVRSYEVGGVTMVMIKYKSFCVAALCFINELHNIQLL